MIPRAHGRPENDLLPLLRLWRVKAKPENLTGTLQDGWWWYLARRDEPPSYYQLPPGEAHWDLLVRLDPDPWRKVGELTGTEERIQGRLGFLSLTVLKVPEDASGRTKDSWGVYVSVLPWRPVSFKGVLQQAASDTQEEFSL